MNVDEIRAVLVENLPGCEVEIIRNEGRSGQHSLLLPAQDGVRVAMFLRDWPDLRMDYCSNVTGIDWPLKETSTKVQVRKTVDGVEMQADETRVTQSGGFLEVVYHLYSMSYKTGPLVLRMRTEDRGERVRLPSLTPVWRSAEFQEREIFDLFGVIFDGHPDLRRLLMWDGYEDHPMRRDYVDPDDFEYEPTAHDEVLARAEQHRAEGGSH